MEGFRCIDFSIGEFCMIGDLDTHVHVDCEGDDGWFG